MGVFTSLQTYIKEKRSKRKAAKSQKSQSQSLQQDAQQGLWDEHLASVPPPQQVREAEKKQVEKQEGIGQAGGEAAVQREVRVEAPVPLAATTEAPAANTEATNTSTEPTNTSKKEDKMATDEEYMDFLDKANEDPSKGTAKSESKGKAELKATDTDVPAPLTKATKDAFYVSDADEPFVPVALKFDGKTLPDEAAFTKLVNYPDPKKAKVEIMDIGEWDPQGQYKDVVEATREVSKGSDVRVYRIGKEGARAEYWVVGLEGGKLLGVKALAVES